MPLRTYDIVTGVAILRPKSIINVFSITDGTSCEGDGNSSKKVSERAEGNDVRGTTV